MTITLNQSGTSGVITLEGELTLSQAMEVRSTLIKALIDTDQISIVMENVKEIDLSCLQLLCSAHRSAVRLNKHVAFAGNPQKTFRDAVEESGFARMTGCKLDCDKGCLWAVSEGAHHG